MPGLCPAAHSPASPNHTIAMTGVQYYAGPLGWAGHPRLPITDGVGMMGSPSTDADVRHARIRLPP